MMAYNNIITISNATNSKNSSIANSNSSVANNNTIYILQSYIIILLLFFTSFMISALGIMLVYNKVYKKKEKENNIIY